MKQVRLSELLESHGIPASFQRLRILELLVDKPGHYRAEEVFDALKPVIPTLSKSTVYNSLKLFSEKGILRTLQLEEGVLHYDGILDAHGHFQCEKCGDIINFPLPDAMPAIALPGARVHQTDLIVRGVCQKCLQE